MTACPTCGHDPVKPLAERAGPAVRLVASLIAGLREGEVLRARDVQRGDLSERQIHNALTYLALRGNAKRLSYGVYVKSADA